MLPEFDLLFWQKFWPSLFSSLLVSFMFTIIITWLLYLFRKPKLEVELSIAHTGGIEKFLVFKLKNIGRTGLMVNEAQWFVYFECLFGTNRVFKTKEDLGMVIFDNGSFYQANGFNEVPCLPGSSIDLTAIEVEPSKDAPYKSFEEARFFASITTNRGTWHPSFSFKNKKIKYNDGHVIRYIYKINKVIW